MRSIPLATALGVALLSGGTSFAASHREAPLLALDPAADITDVYAFVSYDAANLRRDPSDRKVTLILNVVPGQEPGSGPNYYGFDDNVRYQIVVDNDRDGAGLDDLVYEVAFETEVTKPEQFIRPVALAPVTELRGGELDDGGLEDCERTRLFEGSRLPTVPSNIGPRSTPNYAALAAKGVFEDRDTGIRVFAGQRAETFAIDLGAVFDTINLRVETPPGAPGRPPRPVQTAAEDADDSRNPFGVNNFSGFNVQTIAIEIPIRRLTRDGRPANAANGTIGVWGRTLRQRETVRRGEPSLGGSKKPLLEGRGRWVQVSRMANPLVNELIIRFGRKDFWNATLPEDEALFVDAYRDLDVAGALELVSNVPVPDPPRDDIVQLLLQYAGEPRGVLSDLLRLDMTVEPTPRDQIRRLGIFAHDALGNPTPDGAGFPNGRRPDDDVTDIVVRAAGGPNFIAGFVGDGVGINEQGIAAEFPFLPTPFDGRNRRHVDPGE
jgi:hypothetical protein